MRSEYLRFEAWRFFSLEKRQLVVRQAYNTMHGMEREEMSFFPLLFRELNNGASSEEADKRRDFFTQHKISLRNAWPQDEVLAAEIVHHGDGSWAPQKQQPIEYQFPVGVGVAVEEEGAFLPCA